MKLMPEELQHRDRILSVRVAGTRTSFLGLRFEIVDRSFKQNLLTTLRILPTFSSRLKLLLFLSLFVVGFSAWTT